MTRFSALAAAVALALLAVARPSAAQERGAAALGEHIEGLGTSARVLMIGAHPDDEDTRLITYLARGRHVRTAYLSLTRGDGGQNLIGNELGEALGVIRTEELLAARRVDGAEQYFTRAYDFGFSKSADEAFRHWPRDTILGDMVRVVRHFRPHVLVSVFTGTPRDGHGQHQVAGILARAVWDAAADTVRYPARAFGAAWAPSKFYLGAYFAREGASLTYDVGEYSPLLGRSFAEIAAESRSQHKSQAFGTLQRKGVVMGAVEREMSRVAAPADPAAERSMFDGVDTTLARVARALCPSGRAALDSARALIRTVQRDVNLFEPSASAAPLGTAYRLVSGIACAPATDGGSAPRPAARAEDPDAATSLDDLADRLRESWLLATGFAAEATVPRDLVALGDTSTITLTVYNRGRVALRLRAAAAGEPAERTLLPDSALTETRPLRAVGEGLALTAMMEPPWLATPRRGDLFPIAFQPLRPAESLGTTPVYVDIGGTTATVHVPVALHYADPVRGDVRRPLAYAPAISVTLDRTVEYAPARAPLVRQLRVHLRSAATTARTARVTVKLPAGLTADSVARTVALPSFGSVRTVTFTLRGQLPPGRHTVAVTAESNGETFAQGYTPIEYEHIRPQRIYQPSAVAIEAVDVKLPPEAVIAYIQGVGDNSAAMLQQLGLKVTLLDPNDIPRTDLARFHAVVVGTRAYESNEALVAHNAALLDYVRRGGTMVVQYGQYEMTAPGIMPYPITLARPADRVTDEGSPVRFLDAKARVLGYPNTITARDFAGWVQDRTLYMPRTFDRAYRPVIATNDPGEQPNDGGILVAPYGDGTYVYTTLAFFRQLPAGVPGAARLFVNLLAAHASPTPRAP